MAEDAGNSPPPIPAQPSEISERPQDRHNSGSQNTARPMMYPHLMSGLPPQPGAQQHDGPGLYAVILNPYTGLIPGFLPNTLVPLTYKIPRRTDSSGTAAGEHGQDLRQQHGVQRQVVVRRFHFAFQLDLALLLKLAAVVFLFSQEGSRKRLIVLVLFAMVVYLYQTGVLHPLVRWIQRGGAPPQPRPAVPPENAPMQAPDNRNEPRPEENARVENENQPPETENPPAANENRPEPERGNGLDLWGIAGEIQTFVIGFIASLLPGFHHHND